MKKFDIASTMNENLNKQLDFQNKIVKQASDKSNKDIVKELLVLASRQDNSVIKQELQLLATSIASESGGEWGELFAKFGLK
jgi:hypothetical protein